MTVYLDPSERRDTSRMPHLSEAIEAEGLERLTGADLLVSPLTMPPVSEVTLRKHLATGACLVQVKFGEDLVHSLGDRLSGSLARMVALGGKSAQHVLLCVGKVETDPLDGEAIVDGHKTGHDYFDVAGALAKWCARGGVVEWLPRSGLMPKWLGMKLRHMHEFHEHPEHTVIPVDAYPPDGPEEGDWLQLPRAVTDWRRVIAAFQGIGPTRATALRQAMLEHHASDDLLTGLVWATTKDSTFKIPGWGNGVKQRVREQLGLHEMADLRVVWVGYSQAGEQESDETAGQGT